MEQDDGSIGKLARVSRRLNLGLVGLLLLSLALVGISFWALQRVLQEERDKIDFHFTRLVGDIREHEAFLLRVARQGDEAARRQGQASLTLQPRLRWHAGSMFVQEGREFPFALPFTLVSHEHRPAGAAHGPLALGVLLASTYSSFWSTSTYPVPQTLLFDLNGETRVLVPALERSPALAQGGLARDGFLGVVERVVAQVREQPPAPGRQVHWGSGDCYRRDGRLLLGYVGVDLPDSLWWAGERQRQVIAASLLDLERVNDYQQTLARPLFDQLTVLAPGARRLLGPPVDPGLHEGLNLGARGLLFMLHSRRLSGWTAVYAIGYPLFFRHREWPLLGLPLLLLVGLGGGCYGLRWYSRQVLDPASAAHRQVVESDVFSRAVIDTAPVALCVLRRGGRQLILHNRLATQWLGSEAEILALARDWRLGEAGRNPCERCLRSGGRYLQAAFAATRYHGEDALLCVFQDITAYRQAQDALAEAKRAADSANAAKTLFLASMSHELRTPLYSVLGTLELLGLTGLDVRQRGYLQNIQGSSAMLLQLISDLLDVSRIEAGQMTLAPVDFSPLELAEEVMRGFAAVAAARHLQLYACIDVQVPARLRGDAMRIRQILDNLLSNALKFTEAGRVTLRLKVLERSGQRARLQWQVSDTGIGIPEALQSHLFDAFFQVEGAGQGKGGVGLGLSICWHLTRLMGGELRVLSEPGLGSSFSLSLELPDDSRMPAMAEVELQPATVYLRSAVAELARCLEAWLSRWGCQVIPGDPPASGGDAAVLLELLPDALPACHWAGARVQVVATAASQPQFEQGAWRVGLFSLEGIAQALALALRGVSRVPLAPCEVDSPGALGLRVLVAEDNPVNQVLLREQLETLGCRVSLAGDGCEALRLFDASRFDVLLTDVNMPRLNGYELTRELRGRGLDIPIIGVTANAMREEGERCRAAGMNAWLVKPLSLRGLHGALSALAVPCAVPPAERLVVPEHMRRQFLQTMTCDLQEAERACRQSDPVALRQALHRMAGALAVVRGKALVRSCRLLDAGLEQGDVQVEDLRVAGLLGRIAAALRWVEE